MIEIEACAIAAHELALFTISDSPTIGLSSNYHCEYTAKYDSFYVQSEHWGAIAFEAAEKYAAPECVEKIFSVATILLCASELAEYYGRHVQETTKVCVPTDEVYPHDFFPLDEDGNI